MRKKLKARPSEAWPERAETLPGSCGDRVLYNRGEATGLEEA